MSELDNDTPVTVHLDDDLTLNGRIVRHVDECNAVVYVPGQYIRVDTTKLHADQPKAEVA